MVVVMAWMLLLLRRGVVMSLRLGMRRIAVLIRMGIWRGRRRVGGQRTVDSLIHETSADDGGPFQKPLAARFKPLALI